LIAASEALAEELIAPSDPSMCRGAPEPVKGPLGYLEIIAITRAASTKTGLPYPRQAMCLSNHFKINSGGCPK